MAHNPYCVDKSWQFAAGFSLRHLWPKPTPTKKITNGGKQARPPATPSPPRPPPFNPDARRAPSPSRPPPFNPETRQAPPHRRRVPLPSDAPSRQSPPPPKYTVNPPSYPALDLPPKYADIAFVKDYHDPFYDTHVLYEAFGVYRDQSYEDIYENWKDKLDDAFHKTKNEN